ncbi:glycoside-pentoside-hexuronide (GPH):cation symporter [Eubacteriales bacterium DFI.9.88]|nr:glycoside-pentoside-hexuronide (GPH):cation symporter [Eubacteriales bacterium DFI.9.88]
MSNTNSMTEKLPLRVKIAYGSIEFSNSLGLVLFTSFGMYFLTDIAGLSPGIAGTITALGTLINALTGPLFGVASDSCTSKYGRRRPFIVAAAVPFGLCIWLLFSDFGLGPTAKTVYFAIMVILLYAIICWLDVPYTSLGAELTKDYDERSTLNFWRSFFCQVSSIISGALPISIAAYLGTMFNDAAKGWSVMALIFGIISAIVILIGWRGTRGQERHKEDNEKLKLKDTFQALKNRSFLYIIALYSAGVGAYSIGLMVNIYFLSDYVALSEGQVSITLIIFNVSAIAWLPLIPWVSHKFSKRAAWIVFMGIWMLSIIAIYLFVKPGDTVLIYLLTAIGGAGSMVAYTVGWAMLPDCVEVDEFKTGKRREGLYYGILTIVQKGSSALVIFIGGLLLELVKYDETLAVQSEATCTGLKNIYTFGTCFFILLSFLFVVLYPITREKHAKLLQAIEQKRAGEEPDITGIENLVK